LARTQGGGEAARIEDHRLSGRDVRRDGTEWDWQAVEVGGGYGESLDGPQQKLQPLGLDDT
jgi:hypothetical protein